MAAPRETGPDQELRSADAPPAYDALPSEDPDPGQRPGADCEPLVGEDAARKEGKSVRIVGSSKESDVKPSYTCKPRSDENSTTLTNNAKNGSNHKRDENGSLKSKSAKEIESEESPKPLSSKKGTKKVHKKPESFMEHLVHELRPNRNLLLLKLLTFFFYGGMYTGTSFFTLHMKQLGITIQEIAVITFVLPIPAIIGPVVSGMIADWLSRFKLVLVGNAVLTIICGLCLTLTPTHTPQVVQLPPLNHSMMLINPNSSCVERAAVQQWSCDYSCAGDSSLSTAESLSLACDSINSTYEDASCFVRTSEDSEDCGHEVLLNTSQVEHPTGSDFAQCRLSCEPVVESVAFTNSRTFWIYFFIRFLVTFFMNAAFSLMDTSIVAVLRRRGGDYGKQRLMAMMSLATVPFFSSLIIQEFVTDTEPANYHIAYYVMAGFLLFSLGIMYFINLELEKTEEKEESHFWTDVKKLLKNKNIVIFQLIMFLLGANWGFLESYLFVFLQSLNAPPYLMGLTLTFGCVTGIPMLLVADKVIRALGRDRIFFIGFMAYTVRMFGYSFITNPWHCFIFESLEVFTYQIMWVAAVTSFTILAPPSLLGTMAGITGAVHYNVGRGGGTFLGGFLMGSIGIVWTFRSFGIASFVFAVFYWLWQRKHDTFAPQSPTKTEPTEKEREELEQFI